ncbi:Olfactory receptor 5B12 [Lemmus lemmus]
MVGFLTGNKIISYNACAAQMFFFVAFIAIESLILASMAYDRHAAVCKPLHYTTTMTRTTCIVIVTCCYMCGILQSSIHVALAFRLSFCLSNIINHFVILNTYLLIFIAILRMRSADAKKKAFSTCASHLITVSIFFGSLIFMYLQPSSSHTMETDKIASVFYTMVIPMLNPLVYSLRNKEVKNAFMKVVRKLKSAVNLVN